MIQTISLNQDWKLREEALSVGKSRAEDVSARTEGWMAVPSVPCDIHTPLIQAGVIQEPTIANNCFDCEWTEDRSWWFQKTFTVEEDWLTADTIELVFESLDCMADIFLNGRHLAFHPSALYEFRMDVRDRLHPGRNVLLVRLTAGTDHISRADAADSAPWVACEWRGRDSTRGDDRRAMLRKAQYVFGWDQSLHIATCGIMGDVYLEICRETAIRSIAVHTEAIHADGSAQVQITAEVDSLAPVLAPAMRVTAELAFHGSTVACETHDQFGLPGINYITFHLHIADANLWWPNGMGDPNLYDVSVTVETEHGSTESKTIQAGIRTIEVCHDWVDENQRAFYFRVNGKRIFCKGVNWIPCDAIYCRADAQTRASRLKTAQAAHCNMVRTWGGNTYEPDDFYESCDRLGLMVYQEFAFACAGYPDNLEWFRREVEKEAVYQVKRLRSHPCIAIWSGNGECTGHLLTYKGMNLFAGKKKPEFTGGTQLFNYTIPRVLHLYAPHIYYWTASPYGGSCTPDGDERGDQHKWISLDLRPESTQARLTPEYYDTVNCKFVSEFGYFGPAKAEEITRYLGGNPISVDKSVWKNHTNTFECGITRLAIEKYYLGSTRPDLDSFLLYGGLFQGTALAYALGSLRCLRNNSGTLVWCLNDNFGEMGFSLRDHGGNAKIAYYFVKRAYAPVRLLLRPEGTVVNVWCTNDTPQEQTFRLEYGYVSFSGEKSETTTIEAKLEPFCKQKLVGSLCPEKFDLQTGLLYASASDASIDSAIFRAVPFRELKLPAPAKLHVSQFQETPEGVTVCVTAEQYAHAVHFNLPADIELSDDYFDLLPGETKQVTIYSKQITPERICPECVFVSENAR